MVNWSAWAGWQYSDQGQIPGISGFVDRDVFTDAMFLESAGQVKPVDRPKPSSNIAVYQVKPGDTLWHIALLYRVSVSAIVEENGITNPGMIYPGEKLRIPIRDDGAEADDYYYTVRPGDTLSAIAAKYRTTVRYTRASAFRFREIQISAGTPIRCARETLCGRLRRNMVLLQRIWPKKMQCPIPI